MKEKYAKFVQKYPFIKWFTNIFLLVTVFFGLWWLFFDTYSYFDHREINQEIDKLQKQKEFYQSEIEKDVNAIEKLNPFLDEDDKSYFEDVQFHISDLRKEL